MAKKEQVNVTLLMYGQFFPGHSLNGFALSLLNIFQVYSLHAGRGDYHLSSWEGSIAGYLEHFVTIKNVWEKVAFKGQCLATPHSPPKINENNNIMILAMASSFSTSSFGVLLGGIQARAQNVCLGVLDTCLQKKLIINVLIVILLIYEQTCRGLRLKGNDHFAARDYHMAVACYSQAVMLR